MLLARIRIRNLRGSPPGERRGEKRRGDLRGRASVGGRRKRGKRP